MIGFHFIALSQCERWPNFLYDVIVIIVKIIMRSEVLKYPNIIEIISINSFPFCTWKMT